MPTRGVATYELGELQLRMGNLDLAEAFLCRAQELGMLPEPGRALLYLARGDAVAAAASIEAALAEVSGDRLTRTCLLPAAVDIALANGELGRAREAAVEIARSAEEYGATAFQAASACAAGAIALTTGNAGGDCPPPPRLSPPARGRGTIRDGERDSGSPRHSPRWVMLRDRRWRPTETARRQLQQLAASS